MWTRRKRPKKSDAIGRIYSAMPSSGERFFLRMLLIKIPGATSFDFLKTVQDSLCSTFKDACRLRGYLADDGDWINTMREACSSSMPKQIRHLFVSLLYNNPEIPNALTLWEMFREDMSEDYRFQRARSVGARLIPFEEGDFQNSLHDINDQFGELSDYTKNNESYDLPMPTMERLHVLPENAAVASELAYDVDEQKHIVEDADTHYQSRDIKISLFSYRISPAHRSTKTNLEKKKQNRYHIQCLRGEACRLFSFSF
jgi:hypothetical protein